MNIKKSDDSLCRTWYDNTAGCPAISQDRDNANGGLNGPETVTLLDNTVNSEYTYLIAIEDYEFENNGEDFINSGAGVMLLRNIK